MRALVVIALVLGLGSSAAADPTTPASPAVPAASGIWYHAAAPVHLTVEGGGSYDLPAGYYLPEPAWHALDTEVRRLQTTETRLEAENRVLRRAVAGWTPGWKVLATAVVVGLAGGWYLHTL